jgi:glycosyltransferase involved in cell wall biosynthesis
MLAIVIPAYKPQFFELMLNSIAVQSNKKFKCYIFDDAAPEKIKAVSSKFPDYHYTRFDENMGGRDLVGHWHRCLKSIEEEWVWLFSDDDIMSPDCVDEFYKALDLYPNAGAFRFTVDIIDADGQIIGSNKPIKNETGLEFLLSKLSGKQSYMPDHIFNWKKLKEINGGIVKFPLAWHSDDATWCLLGETCEIVAISSAVVQWRRSGINICSIRNVETLKIKLCASMLFYLWCSKKLKLSFSYKVKFIKFFVGLSRVTPFLHFFQSPVFKSPVLFLSLLLIILEKIKFKNIVKQTLRIIPRGLLVRCINKLRIISNKCLSVLNRTEKHLNLLACAVSPYENSQNQYVALIKKSLTTINVYPQPFYFNTNADFIWLHWFEDKANKEDFSESLAFLKASKVKGQKIIWNVHNKISHETTNAERVKDFMKLLADVSHKIIIHSKITTQVIEEIYGKEENVLNKIVYVPHPHYIGTYGLQKRNHCLTNNKLNLCFFGAVRKYKNIELLISVIKELNFNDVELNIYGNAQSSEYAQSLEDLIGENRNIKTHFKFIADRKVPEILAKSHLIILPYDLDSSLNSGTTILAFSYGRSVISPLTGTLSDVEDKSLFFAYSYNDPIQHKEELKKQIIAVREKYKGNYNELLDLGEKSKNYVSENNSFEEVAKQLEQVFEVKYKLDKEQK